MNEDKQKIPRGAWLYVGLLVVAVLVFWSFFWPTEFKQKVKEENKGLAEIVKEFINEIKENQSIFKQLNINSRKPLAEVPAELINQLKEKVDQQLWQERTELWPEWSNEKISFKIPPHWFAQEKNGQYIISSFDQSLSIRPNNWVEINISIEAGAAPADALKITQQITGAAEPFQQIIKDFIKTVKISL